MLHMVFPDVFEPIVSVDMKGVDRKDVCAASPGSAMSLISIASSSSSGLPSSPSWVRLPVLGQRPYSRCGRASRRIAPGPSRRSPGSSGSCRASKSRRPTTSSSWPRDWRLPRTAVLANEADWLERLKRAFAAAQQHHELEAARLVPEVVRVGPERGSQGSRCVFGRLVPLTTPTWRVFLARFPSDCSR